MTIVATFIDGPLDGTLWELQDGRTPLYFPRAPSPASNAWFHNPDAPLKLPDPYVYERHDPIVAGEAVYHYAGLA